ncbi:hypothetical protein Nmel_000533, partial [Mimus melanotis]
SSAPRAANKPCSGRAQDPHPALSNSSSAAGPWRSKDLFNSGKQCRSHTSSNTTD